MSKTINIEPIDDRIIVQFSQEKEQVRGGILIPDAAKEKPQEAEVIAVGPGALNDKGERLPMPVTVGQYVLVSKYGGTEIKHNEEKYTLLRRDDVLAVIHK